VQVKDSNNDVATQPYTVNVYAPLTLPANSTLPAGFTGVAYNGTIAAQGGSGNYCYTVPTLAQQLAGIWDGLVTGLPNTTGACNYISGSVQITGTPTNPPTPPYNITFNMTVVDLTTGRSVTLPYSISVTAPTPVQLPTPNPITLPSATVGQSYTGSINATGGVAPYTWSINGTSVPNNNSLVSVEWLG
jgi:hypothetical protein